MSSLVASAWLDKDLKYTLRFVSKSVFGFLATIALVLRTVEWSKYKDKEPKSCQNICIGVTGKNPDFPTFNAGDEKDCDTQELALNKRSAGHSILIFQTLILTSIIHCIGKSSLEFLAMSHIIKVFHF